MPKLAKKKAASKPNTKANADAVVAAIVKGDKPKETTKKRARRSPRALFQRVKRKRNSLNKGEVRIVTEPVLRAAINHITKKFADHGLETNVSGPMAKCLLPEVMNQLVQLCDAARTIALQQDHVTLQPFHLLLAYAVETKDAALQTKLRATKDKSELAQWFVDEYVDGGLS